MVMDFFGNVQNVDVDGDNANITDPGSLKEDLVAIARLVEEWKRRESHEQASSMEPISSNTTETVPTSTPPYQRSPGAMKMDDSKSWSNQLVGLSVLTSLGAVWFAGSLLVKS